MLFILQMQPSVPKKSLGSEECGEWCIPGGYHVSERKQVDQAHSLQNLSFAKGSVAGGLFPFLRTLPRSHRKLN